MKWPIVLILFIVLISSVSASPACTQETVIPCTVMTPVIQCPSPTYKVFDQHGNVPQNGSLTSLGNGIYSFELENVTINNVYTLELCSNQTTQVTVIPYESQETDKGSVVLGLLISQFLIMLFFLYFSHVLGEETDHDQNGEQVPKFIVLRIFLVFVSFIWVYKLYSVFTAVIESFIGISALITVAGITPFTWIFVVFTGIYLFITIFYMLSIIKENKINQLNM